MNSAQSQTPFLILCLLSIPVGLFGIYETIRPIVEAGSQTPTITVDSRDQYFLLASIFWLLFAIQWKGLRNDRHWLVVNAGPLILGLFLACLVLAHLIPALLTWHIESSGYHRCFPPDSTASSLRGQTYYFSNDTCLSFSE